MPLLLNTGMGAGWPGAAGTNAEQVRGPSTAAEAGFGISGGGAGVSLDAKTTGVLSVGTLALAALIYIWWSLPR